MINWDADSQDPLGGEAISNADIAKHLRRSATRTIIISACPNSNSAEVAKHLAADLDCELLYDTGAASPGDVVPDALVHDLRLLQPGISKCIIVHSPTLGAELHTVADKLLHATPHFDHAESLTVIWVHRDADEIRAAMETMALDKQYATLMHKYSKLRDKYVPTDVAESWPSGTDVRLEHIAASAWNTWMRHQLPRVGVSLVATMVYDPGDPWVTDDCSESPGS